MNFAKISAVEPPIFCADFVGAYSFHICVFCRFQLLSYSVVFLWCNVSYTSGIAFG